MRIVSLPFHAFVRYLNLFGIELRVIMEISELRGQIQELQARILQVREWL